jgi:hypothetical protein
MPADVSRVNAHADCQLIEKLRTKTELIIAMKQTTYQPNPQRPRHLLLVVGLVWLSASPGLEMFAAENAVPANTVSASAETATSERANFYTVDFPGGPVEKTIPSCGRFELSVHQ